MRLNVDHLLIQALQEDITSEDVSTNAVMPSYQYGQVQLICKEDGIIAGLEVFERVFYLLDKSMEVKYYICKHCGNIVEKVKDKGVPVICCGEPMQELKAGVTDAAVEKHVPVYTIEGSHVHVVVGETKHPMLEEHFIEWITLNTNQGIYRKQLNPGQEPVADFCLCDGEQVEEVYAYCNLHGLWKC